MPGVGTGEFARLVPRNPTEVGDDNADTTKGVDKINETDAAPGAKQSQQQQRHPHRPQNLLEDLVPPAGKKALPGTGIPFVVEGDEVDEGRASGGRTNAVGHGAGTGEAGRALSVFEVQALQKARARQRERMEAGEPQVRHTARGGRWWTQEEGSGVEEQEREEGEEEGQ